MNRGDGAAIIDLYANRWTDFAEEIIINNELPGAAFTAEVRLRPDTPGAALASFTVSAPAVGGGTTEFSISLTEGQVEAMPEAAETGDDLTLYWDLVMELAGAKRVLFAGKFIVLAGVTQA